MKVLSSVVVSQAAKLRELAAVAKWRVLVVGHRGYTAAIGNSSRVVDWTRVPG